ncbi:MAG: PAS domain S-box protein [Polyangiaceae bacterium]|nr:PAS domain S-box protein [Polyangiaceae bacterium]
MRSFHFSIRIGVPLSLLAFMVLLGGFSVVYQTGVEDRYEEQRAAAELNRRLTSFEATLDFLYSRDAVEQVQQEVGSLHADQGLDDVVIVDENDIAVAAADRTLLGKGVRDIEASWARRMPAPGLTDAVRRARSRRAGEVRLSSDRGWLTGAYPVTLGRQPGELRPSRVGALLVAGDLGPRKAELRRDVLLHSAQSLGALGLFTVLLGIGAHFVITRQISRLVTAAEALSAGNWSARAGLSGRSELATVGAAFDAMAESVAASQRKLREQGEQIRLLMDSAAEGIFGVDAEGKCTFVNRACLALLGLESEDELLSRKLDALDHPPWGDEPAPPDEPTFIRKTLRDGEPTHEEVRVVPRAGEPFLAECWSHPIRRDGAVVGAVVTAIDITERKRSEALLRERLDTIERQRETIRSLGAPIIEVWDGVLTVPVLGDLDARRATEITEALLAAIVQRGARIAIIDLTGVDIMDSATADRVVRLVATVEMVGARGVVVGIQPQVARALVDIGADLSRLTTLANLREALLHAMGQRGSPRARARARARAG